MLEHMVLQAMMTAFCGFLIRESYGKAAKQLSKRFKSSSEQVEGVLTSLLLLPGQQSSVLWTQERHLNLLPNYPGCLQASNSQSLNLPGLNIGHSGNLHLSLGKSFNQEHSYSHFCQLKATGNMLIHESGYASQNLLHNSLQRDSDVFIDPSQLTWDSTFRTQEPRNLNTTLLPKKSTPDELLPILLRVLLIERERQIQMLTGMLSTAINRPAIYAETYQNQSNTLLNPLSGLPKYDLRGATFSGGFAETVQDRQIGGSHYNYALAEEQTIVQAIAELQTLLKQLKDESVS